MAKYKIKIEVDDKSGEVLSVKFQGLDARLTGVEGARCVKEILA